ncbi:MAG: LL-diaminopimelate aminotransferase [Eubacteriales bacterium]|nr:LL-diaminopimelate aminotransferase [Eubacteriales bacterium]
MFHSNTNYQRLQGSYLFSTIARKVNAFKETHPEVELIRLGIGDVTQPIAPSIIKAMHAAVEEMGNPDTFHGYAPDLGYDFLRKAIAGEYREMGCSIAEDEVFVSDGAKSDSANIQEIFHKDAKVAVCDPVYPVYVDSNVMAGRSGEWETEKNRYSRYIYMTCSEENGFTPEFPEEDPDMIYLCFPNNPTGMTISKEKLQEWVDYANRIGAVIIYDAAYEAYISDPEVPHSIYQCSGAETCAIEIRSFSKNAGFTGVRLGFTVVPKALKDADGISMNSLWARRHGTCYNGAPYIIQKAGEAVYSEQGQKEIREQIAYYMKNAAYIREGLESIGLTVYGGVNAPYIWLKCPDGMDSWTFFDRLLTEAHVVGTPGSGFGAAGEGFFRLTAFGTYENTVAAVERIKAWLA